KNHKPTVEYGFRRVIITITLVVASLLELIDVTIVNVAITNIADSFGADLSTIAWLIAGYSMATAIVVPITGRLAAIFGRRRYFIGSILLFTFSSFMCGQSGSINALIFWRIVQGAGGGALLATANTVLVEIYPDDMVGFANSMFGIGAVLGPAIGPILGGYLVSNYAWPWIFYVNIPIGILAAVLSMIYIKEPPQKMKVGAFDWQGLLFLIIGVGALQVVLEQGAHASWFKSNYIIFLTIAATIGITSFIYWEIKKAKNPMVDLTILKNREVILGSIFIFILGVGLFGSLFLLPIFQQRLLGFSAFQSGLSFIPAGVASFIMMPALGILLKKGTSPRLLATIGLGLFAVSLFMFSWQDLQPEGIIMGDFFLPMVLNGIGKTCLFVPLMTITMSRLKGADIAQGAGLANMSRLLGGSFGVALTATFINYRSVFYRSRLATNISNYNHGTEPWVDQLTQFFMGKEAGLIKETHQVYAILDSSLVKNVVQLSYSDAFFCIGLFFLFCIPCMLFIRKVK